MKPTYRNCRRFMFLRINKGGKYMRKLINSQMIGKTIKTLRESKHMTQSEVADLVCYSERNIRRIETSGTNNLDVVNRFAEIFDISALDILNGDVFFLSKIKKALAIFIVQYLL